MRDFCFQAWKKLTSYKESNFAFSPYAAYCGFQAYRCLFEKAIHQQFDQLLHYSPESLELFKDEMYSLIMSIDSTAAPHEAFTIPQSLIKFTESITPSLHIIGKLQQPTAALHHRLIELHNIWRPREIDSSLAQCQKMIELRHHIISAYQSFCVHDDLTPRFNSISHLTINSKLLSPDIPVHILPSLNISSSYNEFPDAAVSKCNETIQHKTGGRCVNIITPDFVSESKHSKKTKKESSKETEKDSSKETEKDSSKETEKEPSNETTHKDYLISEESYGIITSGIFLKGLWDQPFYIENGRFETHDGSDIPIDIFVRAGRFRYASLPDLEIIQITFYRAIFSLYILLPKSLDIDNFCEIRDILSESQMNKYLNMMKMTEIICKIPKFSFNFGSVDLFKSFDFENIPKIHLIHQISMTMSENGIETGNLHVPPVSIQYIRTDEDTPVFYANHPFIFIFRDDGLKIPLIMGMFTDPRTVLSDEDI